MRSTDEQLRLIRNRASGLRLRRERMLRRGAAAGCLLLAAALGLLLPGTGGSAVIGGGAYGSIILTSPALSYIVIAILAFILGVCVTLLCLHHRRRTGSPKEEEQ